MLKCVNSLHLQQKQTLQEPYLQDHNQHVKQRCDAFAEAVQSVASNPLGF